MRAIPVLDIRGRDFRDPLSNLAYNCGLNSCLDHDGSVVITHPVSFSRHPADDPSPESVAECVATVRRHGCGLVVVAEYAVTAVVTRKANEQMQTRVETLADLLPRYMEVN